MNSETLICVISKLLIIFFNFNLYQENAITKLMRFMKTKDGSKLLQSQMIMIFGANVADLVVG